MVYLNSVTYYQSSFKVCKMEITENYKRELISIFFAQRWLIFLVTLIVFVGAILVSFCWPATYSASVSILVRGKKAEKNPGSLDKEGRIHPFPLKKEDLYSEIEILTSPDVIERAIRYLQEKKLYHDAETINSKDVYKIKSNLKAEIIPAFKRYQHYLL